MITLLKILIEDNPFHLISKGITSLPNAQKELSFDIPREDPNHNLFKEQDLEYLWVYTYPNKESLEQDLKYLIDNLDLFSDDDPDYTIDELDTILYGATIIKEQDKYKPLILQNLWDYQENYEGDEPIDYYFNLIEDPKTLYQEAEQKINLIKSISTTQNFN